MLPIVFINLDRDLVRRQALDVQLSRLGLSACRLPGVLWADLPTDIQQRFYDPVLNARTYPRPLVAGEKGCYASHFRAAEHLLAGDAPAHIVLEDDVCLSDTFADVVSAVARLPVGWDMVKFNSRDHERPLAKRDLCPGHELIVYRRVPSMGTGYAMSRRGAQKMLAHRVPFGRPVDVDFRYWWECDWRVLGVMPGVVALSDQAAQSSIWTERPGVEWAQRLQKWRLQLGYSVLNAVHRSAQILPPVP
jgi:glycosyl transferase, family 25